MAVTFTASGSFVPPRRVSNEDIVSRIAREGGLSLEAGLIRLYTGIEYRPVGETGDNASTMAVKAVRSMEAKYPGCLEGVGLLIFASASRDMVEPATAHVVASELGLSAHCFDLTNACNSLINAIDVAAAFIDSGRFGKALVVSGELPSSVVRFDVSNMRQLRECFAGYTFGDAGAALILEPCLDGGLVYFDSETHSNLWSLGGVFGGGTLHPRDPDKTFFKGDGAELKAAFESIGTGMIERMASRTGFAVGEFSKVILHQVTVPYFERVVDVLGLTKSQVVPTVGEIGNVASATLGVQLDRILPELTPGELVLMLGLGGGVSLQCIVWQVPA